MKAGTFIKLLIVLLIIAGGVYWAKPELFEDYLPESLTGKKAKVKKAKKVKKARKVEKVKAQDEKKSEEPEVIQAAEAQESEEEAAEEEEDTADAPAPVPTELGKVPAKLKNIGIIKGGEWKDCAKVKARLEEKILSGLGGASDAEIGKWVRKDKNKLLLAQWVVADAELRAQQDLADAKENA